MEAPVSAELAGRHGDMADLNRAVEAMAEMDPDGEISAESMARLAEIAPAAGPVDVNAAKATVQGLGNDAVAVLAANGADERAWVRDFHALFTRDFDIPSCLSLKVIRQ